MKIHSKEARIRYLKWVLNDIYGEERVEVSQRGDKYLDAIVHFPYIKITNIVEQEHDIYDLFVKFIFINEPSCFYLNSIVPARTTFTAKDLIDSETLRFYIHSHFPSVYDITKFRDDDSFCMGSTEFALFLNRLYNESYIVKDLAMLFHSFNSYIEWESLEGKPHIQMSTLGYNIYNYKPIEDLRSIRAKILNETIKNLDKFSFRLEEGKVYISGISDIIKQSAKRLKISQKYYARVIGDRPCWLKINRSKKQRINILNSSQAKFTFKGNPVNIKITIPSTAEVRKEVPLELHPEIVGWVKNKLEDYLLEYLTITYKK